MDDRCSARIIHHERVSRAKETAFSETEVAALANLFKTLADGTRQRIIRALAHEEMCVCDLAAFLGISESAVSHQLRLLRTQDLVRNRREGSVLYYRLTDDHVKRLVGIALAHARR